MDTGEAPPATPAPAEQPEKTKVYYHIDNVDDQYRVDVPVPLAQLTLAAVRPYLSHSRNAKFYLVVWEEEINKHVKQAILDENEPLRPDANGRIEMFLESDAEPPQCNATAAHSKRSSMRFSKSDMRQRPPPPPQTYGRRYAAYEDSSQDESSAFASNVRALSDDDSQYSTDFTSVSQQQQQRHKPYRRRRARRTRPSRASTFLSSTFDDTEISMALDLLTISLRLDPKEPLGLSVVVHKSNGCEGIYVHNVEPNSVVGRDGRITPGSAILEVDDLPLDAYDGAEALDILKAHVKRATEARGILKLTLSQTQGDYRAYPFGGLGLGRVRQEPVRPIDPEAWVKHVDAMRRLNVIPEDSENVMSPHGRAASRQSLQLPPKRSTMGDHHPMPSAPAMPAHRPPPVPRPQPTCGWPSSGVGSSIASSAASGPAPASPQKRFSVHGTDRLEIVRAMAEPGSGLDVRDRTWLNMPMEKSFVGSEMIEWLLRNVEGLEDRKKCERYASELLRDRLILQAVSKTAFTKECYYVFNEKVTGTLQQPQNTIRRGALTLIQNPTQEDSQATLESPRGAKCGGGLGCAFKKVLCLHPQKAPKLPADENVPGGSGPGETHIP